MSEENNTNTKSNKKKPSYKEKVAELEQQLEDQKNDYLRLLADFQNYRQRAEKEKQDIRDKAVVDFVGSLLPAIDNFEMSLKMTDNQEMFVKGVEMIHKNLLDTLKEHHFEEFEPQLGEEFDPYLHDPVTVESETGKSGEVLGVVKKGYKRGDKIVRPARVEIKKEEEESEEENLPQQEEE